jgi:hypothetical protein
MLRLLYSPQCVEGEFAEVELPLYGVVCLPVSELKTREHFRFQRRIH